MILTCKFGACDAEVVQSKGASHRHSVATLVNACASRGFHRFILKSDQEPSIMALVEAARAELTQKGFDVILENSPSRDSQSNGLVEDAVRRVKGLVRTIRYATEQLHGVTLRADHVCLP